MSDETNNENVPFDSDEDKEIAKLEAMMLANPDDIGVEEFAEHEELSTSFAPFWKPAPIDMVERDYVKNYVRQGKGLWFYATPVEFDDRDPDMKRWGLIAEMDLVCYRGSIKDDKVKKVIVRKGEPFTCSVYGSLPLENFIGIPVRVQVVDQVPTDKPKPRWVFRVTASPEHKATLDAERKERARLGIEKLREMRRLNGGAFKKKAKELPATTG